MIMFFCKKNIAFATEELRKPFLVLVVCCESCRLRQRFLHGGKEYVATIKMGSETNTQDWGELVSIGDGNVGNSCHFPTMLSLFLPWDVGRWTNMDNVGTMLRLGKKSIVALGHLNSKMINVLVKQ